MLSCQADRWQMTSFCIRRAFWTLHNNRNNKKKTNFGQCIKRRWIVMEKTDPNVINRFNLYRSMVFIIVSLTLNVHPTTNHTHYFWGILSSLKGSILTSNKSKERGFLRPVRNRNSFFWKLSVCLKNALKNHFLDKFHTQSAKSGDWFIFLASPINLIECRH